MRVYENNSQSMKLVLGLFEHKSFQSQREITKETIQDFLNEKNLSENTALQLCVLKNSRECMLQLLTAGADVGRLYDSIYMGSRYNELSVITKLSGPQFTSFISRVSL